jgi:hypothetical protein
MTRFSRYITDLDQEILYQKILYQIFPIDTSEGNVALCGGIIKD